VITQSDSTGVLRDIEYPSPPRVHWFVLLLSWIVLAIVFASLAPPAYQKLLNSLVVDAWAFRLCLWIKSLDPETRSPFWCDVYVVVELAYALVSIRRGPSIIEQDITSYLAFASFSLYCWTIYLIRSDLLKHYNRREPYGLELNGLMTYMFSFLYFQSQLYPIAKAKKREAEQRAGAPISG
jgi:hypothetical protein